jgi:hypothetical protein
VEETTADMAMHMGEHRLPFGRRLKLSLCTREHADVTVATPARANLSFGKLGPGTPVALSSTPV